MAVAPIPAGFHSVTPHLMVHDSVAAIEFYKKAFGASEIFRMSNPDGTSILHAEIRIGDSVVFLGDEWPGQSWASPARLGGTTVCIHLYVPDVDAVFHQAVTAGAKVLMPPQNMFWGDRYAKVQDPFRHEWSLATHIEDVPPEEMERRAAEEMKHLGSP